MGAVGKHFRRHGVIRRRGIIFVATMWIVLILAAMVLVFARSSGVEALAASNRAAVAKAAAAELAGEQYVLAKLDGCNGDALSMTQINGEQLHSGDGYFWLIRPYTDDTTHATYDYGLIDECGKINVNTAPAAVLANLPYADSDTSLTVSDSVTDWRSPARQASPNGAENDYYTSLAVPYQCKNAPLETTEELLLIKGVTPQAMYGNDLNRNGVIEDAEQQQAGAQSTGAGQGLTNTQTSQLTAAFNNSDATLGLFPYVTIYSKEPQLSASGKKRININGGTAGADLNKALNGVLAPAKIKAIEDAIRAKSRSGRQFSSTLELFYETNLTTSDFDSIADLITTQRAATGAGLVNINTAPRAVLAALPGLQSSDADALIAKRQQATSLDSIAWITTVLPTDKALGIAPLLTTRSFQYSADIVGVSPNGRAFKRVWIVVDTTTSPATIVYRRDLTHLGWPLDPQIRGSLQSGNGPGPITGGASAQRGL